MPDLITVAEFEVRSGRTLTTAQRDQVGALIDDASALVADVVADATVTDTWDAVAGSVPPGIVPVVVAMVRRGLDNPNGYRQESIGSYNYSLGADGASGIFATRQDVRTIRRAAGKVGAGALNLSSFLPYPPA